MRRSRVNGQGAADRGDAWVPPDPTGRSSWVAAPRLRHDSAISELMKRAKSVISRLSFQSLRALSGKRDRPELIAAVAPGRCVRAMRSRASERSPADRQVTTRRHARRHEPRSPIARSQTRLPTSTTKRFAEIRLCGASHWAPAVGRTTSGATSMVGPVRLRPGAASCTARLASGMVLVSNRTGMRATSVPEHSVPVVPVWASAQALGDRIRRVGGRGFSPEDDDTAREYEDHEEQEADDVEN
jgi:hypothetical protein